MKDKRYYIYHVFGKKIGMTTNIQRRVIDEQGYDTSEFEVLLSSPDMEIASNYEKKFQQEYGYKIDRQTYQELIKLNEMKVTIALLSGEVWSSKIPNSSFIIVSIHTS